MNSEETNRQRNTFLFAGALLCLSFFLAFYGAGQSLWLDEAYSVLVTGQNFPEMLVSLEHDVHPPLFYFLLSFWIKIFGNAEPALRGLSAVLYLCSIFAVYRLGKEIYEQPVGLLAAFLYALSPLATGTAHSVRMYALLGLLSALSTLLFAKIFLRNSNSPLVFWLCVIVNTLGTFTQIWFFFLLASQFFVYALLFYKKNRLKFFALQFLSVICFTILWSPILLNQLGNSATVWVGRPGIAEIFTVLLGFYGERMAMVFYFSVIVLLFLSLTIGSGYRRSEIFERFKKHFSAKSTLFFVLIFGFSILIPFLVGQIKPIFGQTRYTIIALPAFVLILAPALYKFVNRKVLTTFCIFLLFLTGKAFVGYYNRPEPCSDRAMTARLLEKAAPGDTLVFTSLSRTATDYYLDRFGAAGRFVEFNFPGELDKHPGWQDTAATPAEREKSEAEAENLLIELRNSAAKNSRIWLFYGLAPEFNNVLKKRLDRDFIQSDKITASCGEPNDKQSDLFYTEILLYESAAE